MSSALATLADDRGDEFIVTSIADQLFGIPVFEVRDVLGHQRITRIPLAPPEVAGVLNLRGHIVTAIDVCRRLGLPARMDSASSMGVVVEHKGELYDLIFDKVSEVSNLPAADCERTPATLDPHWQGVSNGVYRLKDRLLVVLDTARVLQFEPDAEETDKPEVSR